MGCGVRQPAFPSLRRRARFARNTGAWIARLLQGCERGSVARGDAARCAFDAPGGGPGRRCACLQAMSFAWLRIAPALCGGVVAYAPRLLRGVSRAALHGALLLANYVFCAPRKGACIVRNTSACAPRLSRSREWISVAMRCRYLQIASFTRRAGARVLCGALVLACHSFCRM